jgi:hypothetical protein
LARAGISEKCLKIIKKNYVIHETEEPAVSVIHDYQDSVVLT